MDSVIAFLIAVLCLLGGFVLGYWHGYSSASAYVTAQLRGVSASMKDLVETARKRSL